MKQNNRIVYAFFNALFYIGTVGIGVLANSLPINNITTKEISDAYPNLFVPSSITFAVWGLIYLLLGVFVIYQFAALFSKKIGNSAFIEKIGPFFILSSIANMGWIFAWHYQIMWLSFVIIAALLVFLIILYTRLRIGKPGYTKPERAFIHLPVSVYLGWITVAVIANATALLVDIGWRGGDAGEEFWTVVMIVVAGLLTLYIVMTRNDVPYGITVAWALLGIIMKRLSVPGPTELSIVIAASVMIFFIIVLASIKAAKKRIYR